MSPNDPLSTLEQDQITRQTRDEAFLDVLERIAVALETIVKRNDDGDLIVTTYDGDRMQARGKL